MINIKNLFHDLPIARKFYFGFGVIFLIVFLSFGYFYYIFDEINQYVNREISISQINTSVDMLITASLENIIFLRQYNGIYDQSLLIKIKKNRMLILHEINQLKGMTNIEEVRSKLDLYESMLAQKEKLRNEIISAINQNERINKIAQLRHQRELLDDESISYLNRIKEIEKIKLEETRKLHFAVRNKLRNTLFLLFFLLFLGVFLVSFYISKIIISDIELIAASVKDISGGHYDSRIQKINKDELGGLASFLNAMAEKLQNAKKIMLKITDDLKLKLNQEQRAEVLIGDQTKELERIAYYDIITGLPNRILLEKKFASILNKYNNERKIAILFLDIRNFKNINEILGLNYGDQLLREVAARLVSTKDKEDVISRLAGDEFIILYSDQKGIDSLNKKIDLLFSVFVEPFYLNGYSIMISVDLGVAIYPEAGDTFSALLKNAGLALYKAKELDLDKVYFSKKFEEDKKELLEIETILRKGIALKRFYLVYEPIVNSDHSFHAVEVLLRWEPSLFPSHLTNEQVIPIAEKTGLIIPLGNAIVEEALKQHSIWAAKNHRINMSINLSTKQVIQKDFILWIRKLFLQYQIDPAYISFELTETAVMRDIVVAKNNLAQLRELGCGVWVDDFGTGYASMNVIKKLPISGIKIDKSYVQKELQDPKNLAVLKMMFAFAESMEFVVISEGVETEEQFNFLRSLAPQQKMQGFFIAQGLRADEIEKWFAN